MNRKHGCAGTPEYRAWYNMLTRCRRRSERGYKNYGGRGITVCRRWLKFENFLADLGLRPSVKHSLERKNNDRGYSPSNCCWASKAAQLRNTRRNIRVMIDGVSLVVADWNKRLRLPPFRVYARIRAGWSPRAAILTPKARARTRDTDGRFVPQVRRHRSRRG